MQKLLPEQVFRYALYCYWTLTSMRGKRRSHSSYMMDRLCSVQGFICHSICQILLTGLSVSLIPGGENLSDGTPRGSPKFVNTSPASRLRVGLLR